MQVKPKRTAISNTNVGVIKVLIASGKTLLKNFSIGAAIKQVTITGNTVAV